MTMVFLIILGKIPDRIVYAGEVTRRIGWSDKY